MIAPQFVTHVPGRHQPLRTGNAAAKGVFSSAHLVGICGSGMKALAELLVDLGWSVTGSDLQAAGPSMQLLERRGLRLHRGHNDDYVPRQVDVLVYSPAVGPSNPERQRAQQLGIPQMSYSQMLGRLMESRTGVSIAGTHGKSTTTAMVATILRDAGLAPSAAVGAEMCRFGRNGWAGSGDLMVVESCEYQKSFLDLHPTYAAILSIEPDHFDCFPALSDAEEAFAAFAAQVSADGRLLLSSANSVRKLAMHASAPVETFSLADSRANWWGTDLRRTPEGMRFRIFHDGVYFSEISLPMAGEHNVQNALAAAALSHYAGARPAEVRESLADFQGTRRRFERIGSWRGATLIDDYAHHPTAISVTLRSAREIFGRRRIWCLFQPHQVSRTAALFNEFADSFLLADKVLLAPAFTAREEAPDAGGEIVQRLTNRVAGLGCDCRSVVSLDRMISVLEDEARPGDVLLTLGAGDINRIHHELTRKIRRHYAG